MARTLCGCWYAVPSHYEYSVEKRYLPQADLSSHTTILATTTRTVLVQKFVNPADRAIDQVQYTFPLYDGVSVVGFKCTVASRTIVGVVKEKHQARVDYQEAIDRGETAGLLEQLPEAADVFTTRIGNVPPRESITVEIVYLGELKHDAETDGGRFTIPTVIAPRYGQVAADPSNLPETSSLPHVRGGIRIMVDVIVDEGSAVRGLQSPSHPIAVSMGRTSATAEDDSDSFSNHLASATLALGSAELEKDFILVVLAQGQDTPRAMLEHHPTRHGQRALMVTLVPRFNLPPIHPEIVFVVDRSGSMGGKIATLVTALQIFLKSIPVGVKFNICSFGSRYDFLWPKSKTYNQSSLQTALDHLKTFSANYGGTEMLQPVEATVKNRWKDMPLEVMVITDGEIWNQQSLFEFITTATTKKDARFFSLGVGAGASSSLVEGIARAGDGFAQFVGEDEKMDKRVVRMLKGALTPHIHDYTLEVKYERDDDEYEIVESVTAGWKNLMTDGPGAKSPSVTRKVISLFDKSAPVENTAPAVGRYDHLPAVTVPKLLQAPHKIPSLYPFNRTTAYLLISAEACQRAPRAVILRGTCTHGPLELEIPVQDVGWGETIHQLAAKKAIQELEEGRGWITAARDANDKLIKEKYEGRWDEMVEREAVRLGVEFQVGGKWCSFVAVEANATSGESRESILEGETTLSRQQSSEGTLCGAASPTQRKSKWSAAPSQPPFFPCSPSSHNSALGFASSRPDAPHSLWDNANTSHGSGRVAQPTLLSNRLGRDRRSALSGAGYDSTVPFQTPHFGGGVPTSSNASVDIGSTVEKAKKSLALPQVSFGVSSFFRTRASQDRAEGMSSTSFAAPVPPPAAAYRVMRNREQAPGRGGMLKSAAVPATRRISAKSGDLSESEAEDDEMIGYSDEGAGVSDLKLTRPAPPGAPAAAAPPPPPADRQQKPPTIEGSMHALIALQDFDGSWAWGTNLCAVLGIDGAKLNSICESAGVVENGKIRATLVAVAFLQTKAKAEEEVWEMVVEKAMDWLKGKTGEGQLEKVQKSLAREEA